MGETNALRQKVFNGVLWKFMERILAQGISLVVSIILARVLFPDDYSVVSIVTIFFAFCNVFISGGLNTALIQKKDADIVDYSTVLHISNTVSALLYLIVFFAAPYIAAIYSKPILIPLMRVMGITFFVNATKGVICAKIYNDLAFRKFFFSTLVGTFISAVVGVVMAIRGFGPWALVAQQMCNSIIDLIILWVTSKFRFRFLISFKRFSELFKYAWKLFVASIISVLYDEIRPLIVGLRFSTVDLAYYNKGASFPNLINSTISNTMSGVLFPALSKMKDDKTALLNAVRRYIKTASFMIFPVMLGLLVVADTFVEVVLTEKWMMAVPYVRIFCLCYMFDLVQIGNIQAIRAMGRSDVTLITEIIKKSAYSIIIVIFAFSSNTPLIFALSNILCIVVATVVNIQPTKRLLGYRWRDLFSDVSKNMIAAVIMALVVFFMKYIAINSIVLLVIRVIVGAVVYFVTSLALKNENIKYILNLLSKILPHNDKV